MELMGINICSYSLSMCSCLCVSVSQHIATIFDHNFTLRKKLMKP